MTAIFSSRAQCLARRPDLLDTAELDDVDKRMLDELRSEPT